MILKINGTSNTFPNHLDLSFILTCTVFSSIGSTATMPWPIEDLDKHSHLVYGTYSPMAIHTCVNWLLMHLLNSAASTVSMSGARVCAE